MYEYGSLYKYVLVNQEHRVTNAHLAVSFSGWLCRTSTTNRFDEHIIIGCFRKPMQARLSEIDLSTGHVHEGIIWKNRGHPTFDQ